MRACPSTGLTERETPKRESDSVARTEAGTFIPIWPAIGYRVNSVPSLRKSVTA